MVIISQFNRHLVLLRPVGLLLLVSALIFFLGCNSSGNSTTTDNDQVNAQSPVESKTCVSGREHRKNNKEQETRFTKNQTILILAAESDVRAAQLYRFARESLTPEQIAHAEQICGAYDDDFLRLLRERAEVLETATDDNNVQVRLNKIYGETVELSRKIRQEIRQNVLTLEQKKALQANYKEKQKQDRNAGSGS